jgi:hypothetical protein
MLARIYCWWLNCQSPAVRNIGQGYLLPIYHVNLPKYLLMSILRMVRTLNNFEIIFLIITFITLAILVIKKARLLFYFTAIFISSFILFITRIFTYDSYILAFLDSFGLIGIVIGVYVIVKLIKTLNKSG